MARHSRCEDVATPLLPTLTCQRLEDHYGPHVAVRPADAGGPFMYWGVPSNAPVPGPDEIPLPYHELWRPAR